MNDKTSEISVEIILQFLTLCKHRTDSNVKILSDYILLNWSTSSAVSSYTTASTSTMLSWIKLSKAPNPKYIQNLRRFAASATITVS